MRQVFLLFLMMTVLSGCSVVNSLRMIYANDDVTPILPEGQEQTFQQSVEAFYIGEKPYIQVLVNGDTSLLFLIDTGASFTMLFDTDKTAGLTLNKGFPLELRGWGDERNTPAFQTQLQSLAIGDAIFNEVNVGYIPISTSQYYLVSEEVIFDGVIGHDLLRHFNWMFDKQEAKITLSRKSYATQLDDVQIPIEPFFSKITMPVSMRINGKVYDREVYIDTGSRHYFKFNTAFVKNNDIELPSPQIEASDFGLSGEAKHVRIRLPSLMLGGMTLDGIKANVIEAEDEDDFSVVGSALMNQFVTIIDYQSNIITFRAYPDDTFKTQFNLAGLDLRKLQNGNLLVRFVFPQLPTAREGIEAGSEITSINGISSHTISEQDWLSMATIPGTFEFCFVSGSCKVINTAAIAGYSIP